MVKARHDMEMTVERERYQDLWKDLKQAEQQLQAEHQTVVGVTVQLTESSSLLDDKSHEAEQLKSQVQELTQQVDEKQDNMDQAAASGAAATQVLSAVRCSRCAVVKCERCMLPVCDVVCNNIIDCCVC